MKSCPRCYHNNPMSATVCERCAMPLELSSAGFARTCPAGRHVMDPSWSVCAFCKAEGVSSDEVLASASGPGAAPSSRKTLFEGSGGGTVDESFSFPGARDPLSASSSSAATPSGIGPGRSSKPKETVYGANAPVAPAVPGEQRKIIGILITYTWKAEGQIFPVREGRNLIGRDKLADIVIEQDPSLSGTNSTINCQNRFMIADRDSMSGTWVNGKVLDLGTALALANYDRIRAGSTSFTFISINPVMPDPDSITSE